jgi:hypothetical protein
MRPRPSRADALALLGVAGLPALLGFLWLGGPRSVLLDLGPNDAGYLEGFHAPYEIEGTLAARWSRYHARVALPVALRGGPIALAFRYSRVFPQTAVVDVAVSGTAVERFECRGGGFRVHRLVLPQTGVSAAELALRVDSHERRDRGLWIDWLRFELGQGASLRPRGIARWRPLLFTLGVFVLLRLVGFGSGGATLATLPLAAALFAWGLRDPLALAHVGGKLALPGLALAGLCGVLLRRATGGRFVVALFLLSYLVKGAGVFHPSFFYPDVMNARRYILALAEEQGSVAERGVAAQMRVNAAYPRVVAGRKYAFPYSPLYFIPFSWVTRDPGRLEDLVRHVGVAAGAAEVPGAFWLSRLIFGQGMGVAAALLAVLLPPIHSRLFLAMFATLVGHLLDLVGIGAALRVTARPESAARQAAFGAAVLLGFLTYIASLFDLSAFTGFLALLDRRLAPRLFALAALAAAATIAWLYGPFAVVFVREIAPALWAGGGAAAGAGGASPGAGVSAALARIPLFYGWGFPALAVAGLLLARREAAPPARRVVGAWLLAFALLIGLRMGFGLFRDLKEITFVGTLIAVMGGRALEAVDGRGRPGRVAALLVVAGLVAFSAERYLAYFVEYAAPVMRVVE